MLRSPSRGGTPLGAILGCFSPRYGPVALPKVAHLLSAELLDLVGKAVHVFRLLPAHLSSTARPTFPTPLKVGLNREPPSQVQILDKRGSEGKGRQTNSLSRLGPSAALHTAATSTSRGGDSQAPPRAAEP